MAVFRMRHWKIGIEKSYATRLAENLRQYRPLSCIRGHLLGKDRRGMLEKLKRMWGQFEFKWPDHWVAAVVDNPEWRRPGVRPQCSWREQVDRSWWDLVTMGRVSVWNSLLAETPGIKSSKIWDIMPFSIRSPLMMMIMMMIGLHGSLYNRVCIPDHSRDHIPGQSRSSP